MSFVELKRGTTVQTSFLNEAQVKEYITDLEVAVVVSGYGLEPTDFWCIELTIADDTEYAYLYVPATATAVAELGDDAGACVASLQVESRTEPGTPFVKVWDSIPAATEVHAALWPQQPLHIELVAPADDVSAASLAVAANAVCREMAAEGIAHPLSQPISMAALLADLFRHLGQPVPAAVAVVIG